MGRFNRIFKHCITGELSDNKKNDDFEPTKMVFDTETQVVFYKFTEVVPVCSNKLPNQQERDTKVGYMCPYIGEHGRNCRFVDKKTIVEI